MTNQESKAREIDGYRIVVSRYVPKPIWFCTVIRLSDMVRFTIGGRSYSTSDDSFAVGESFVRNVVANNAEFARIEKANAKVGIR